MAKKRTRLPFYGKASQRADRLAKELFKTGNVAGAIAQQNKSRAIREQRMKQAVR